MRGFSSGEPHSFPSERTGETYHHSFFSVFEKKSGSVAGGRPTSHHRNLSSARFDVLFLLFSTHSEFLRRHWSHSPAKGDQALLSVFSVSTQRVTGCVPVALRKPLTLSGVGGYAGKKTTPCPSHGRLLHRREQTEVPKVRCHTHYTHRVRANTQTQGVCVYICPEGRRKED